MPKDAKKSLAGTNRGYKKLNRDFAIGDRIAKTKGITVDLPGTPARQGARRGVVVERRLKQVRSSRAASGFARRWQCVVQWDDSSHTDEVDEQRLIHEAEFDNIN
tara:strand:+ start:470 stop:784 length:315 start_codon:yes stop_codon:yes gene_type:complete